MIRDFDWKLLGTALILSLIGIMAIYSATHYSFKMDKTYQAGLFALRSTFWIKQLIWLLLGLILAVTVSNINYQRFWDLAWFLYVASILLLIIVLAIAEERSGAKRWLQLGPVSFQPAELAKISLIILLARYFTRQVSYHFSDARFHSQLFVFSKTMLVPLAIVFLPFVLIVKQPDLGSSIVLLPIMLAILFCAHVPKRFIALIIVLGSACLPFLWHFLKGYQKTRLLVFMRPDLDPLGAGYTITQSKIAIGSGGFFGKGWLAGTQNQLNFLPERHTDFIFSIIAEEWGFFGSLVVLGLYFILIWRIIEIISQTSDPFGRFVCIGIVTFLSFQLLINIAMTSGIMPVVGLPLPFISYGGSFLLLSFFCIGIVLNVAKQRIIF
jgi:rod shape determining protein RodA